VEARVTRPFATVATIGNYKIQLRRARSSGASQKAKELLRRALCVNNLNNNSNINGNNNLNNRGSFLLITHHFPMTDLYAEICSYDNLLRAYKKARKHKTLRPEVIKFEQDLEGNLLQLRSELILHAYKPRPLATFVICDPKTRKISKSDFRDRVVHHALCNIIEPILEKKFIHDSYANQKGKGTLAAIKRFEQFNRKVSRNNTRDCFVLKADIRHYFDTVDHKTLVRMISRKINDEKVLLLIKTMLENHKTNSPGKGMPLGNLTSQFFANVYLNELDQFVKHKLRVRHYIRYVDDFVIIGSSEQILDGYKTKIDEFLKEMLSLELHPDKSKIRKIERGIGFLGLRIFPHHKILKKRNIRKFQMKLHLLSRQYDQEMLDYNAVYNFMEGWAAYAKNANTYNMRSMNLRMFENRFIHEISSKEIDRIARMIEHQAAILAKPQSIS